MIRIMVTGARNGDVLGSLWGKWLNLGRVQVRVLHVHTHVLMGVLHPPLRRHGWWGRGRRGDMDTHVFYRILESSKGAVETFARIEANSTWNWGSLKSIRSRSCTSHSILRTSLNE